MRELTVWSFPAPGDADEVLPVLDDLVARRIVEIDDAAIVVWSEGLRKPRGRPLGNLSGTGALWDGTWSVLFALIFLVPIAGPAFGAAAGAVAGAVSEFGIPDDFIMRVRATVKPCSSALFLLSGTSAHERLADALRERGYRVEILGFELSDEQERRLRSALGVA